MTNPEPNTGLPLASYSENAPNYGIQQDQIIAMLESQQNTEPVATLRKLFFCMNTEHYKLRIKLDKAEQHIRRLEGPNPLRLRFMPMAPRTGNENVDARTAQQAALPRRSTDTQKINNDAAAESDAMLSQLAEVGIKHTTVEIPKLKREMQEKHVAIASLKALIESETAEREKLKLLMEDQRVVTDMLKGSIEHAETEMEKLKLGIEGQRIEGSKAFPSIEYGKEETQRLKEQVDENRNEAAEASLGRTKKLYGAVVGLVILVICLEAFARYAAL